jgi:hypothetical protein
MPQNKTLKNFRNSFLEKSSKHLVNSFGRVLDQNGKPINSKIVFTNKANVRGRSIRNIIGKSLTKNVGILSTRKNGKTFKPYTNIENKPESAILELSIPNAAAINYRKVNSRKWTPQLRKNPRLNPANSKILANVYAASAPNYKYQTMVDAVWARNNIDAEHKGLISDRLYALYDEGSNNNSENENDEELHAWAVAPKAERQRIVSAAAERSLAAASPLPELPSLNTIRKKSAPKPSLPAYFAAQAKGTSGI